MRNAWLSELRLKIDCSFAKSTVYLIDWASRLQFWRRSRPDLLSGTCAVYENLRRSGLERRSDLSLANIKFTLCKSKEARKIVISFSVVIFSVIVFRTQIQLSAGGFPEYRKWELIVVVKKTFRYPNVFFYYGNILFLLKKSVFSSTSYAPFLIPEH